MPPEYERVTAREAADRLGKAVGTIHCWGARYHARKVRLGRRVLYDFGDLYVIEREVFHGHPVPDTWEERATIRDRCPLTQPSQQAHPNVA